MVSSFEREKNITITNAFQNILHEYNRKLNKIWVYISSDYYNISVKLWFQDNDIENVFKA